MEEIKVANIKKNEINTKKQKLYRSIISLAILFFVLLAMFLVLHFTHVLDKVDSPEEIKTIILQGGTLSYIIFMVIQFLQVTFIPIPAVITTIAGSLVFGPWVALGLSLVAVLAGSLFAFWMGRKFGRKLIYWIAGKEDGTKWINKLTHGKYLFFLMMLFPGFPDDILCIVAGSTKMTYRFFIIVNLITRPIIFAGIVFFAGGYIIPFSGFGIVLWIIVVLVMAVLFYLSIRYQKQIENALLTASKKIKIMFKENKKSNHK